MSPAGAKKAEIGQISTAAPPNRDVRTPGGAQSSNTRICAKRSLVRAVGGPEPSRMR